MRCQAQASVGARGPHVIGCQRPLPKVRARPTHRCHPYQHSPPRMQARPKRRCHPCGPLRGCGRATEPRALWPRRPVLVQQEGWTARTQERTPWHRQLGRTRQPAFCVCGGQHCRSGRRDHQYHLHHVCRPRRRSCHQVLQRRGRCVGCRRRGRHGHDQALRQIPCWRRRCAGRQTDVLRRGSCRLRHGQRSIARVPCAWGRGHPHRRRRTLPERTR